MKTLFEGNWFSNFCAVAALVLSIITFCFNVIYRKKQATLDAFNTLQQQVLDNLNLYGRSQIKEIAGDVYSVKYKEITKYLARIEHFCVGVNSGIYSIKIVKRMAGAYLIGLYEKVEPIIERKRQTNKSEKHYDEFEKLYDSLKKLYSK